MQLSSQNVDSLFRTLLFEQEELSPNGNPPDDAILVDGVRMRVGFHKGRTLEHKEDIVSLLDQLTPDLKDGVSLLSLCQDRDGRLWGQHRDVDLLMMLGMAVDCIVYCAPRDMWEKLPGGLPYYLRTAA